MLKMPGSMEPHEFPLQSPMFEQEAISMGECTSEHQPCFSTAISF